VAEMFPKGAKTEKMLDLVIAKISIAVTSSKECYMYIF
jgi:hypothetical protein